MADGRGVFDYPLKPSKKRIPAITYDIEMEGYMAAHWFGLSVIDYDRLPGSPRYVEEGLCKATVIAAYRIGKRVDAIVQDAQF